MKNSSSDLVKPLFAIMLVTVAVPMITHAAMGSTLESTEYDGFNPRGTQRELFDAEEFIQMRHDRRNTFEGDVEEVQSEESSSTAPCETAASSSHAATPSVLDYYGELTLSQRADLRLHLRTGVCPFNSDVRYRMLCETMLKTDGLIREVRVGPRNSEQTEDQFLRSGGDINQ
jgi:hypothetical protein